MPQGVGGDVVEPAVGACSWSARRLARFRRTGPDSQSTTTQAAPVAASTAAAPAARSSGRRPAVARPSVTTRTRGRRFGSRRRSTRNRSAAASSPSASGVRPPVGSSASRVDAASTDEVAGSSVRAPASRKAITATLSRRWYASVSRASTASLTAVIRCRAPIDPLASTTNSTRLPSRPSRTASRTSSGRSRSGPVSRPRAAWCGAAARTVAGRCSAPTRPAGTRAPVVRPRPVRARERRPGTPSPTPGAVSNRAFNPPRGTAIG